MTVNLINSCDFEGWRSMQVYRDIVINGFQQFGFSDYVYRNEELNIPTSLSNKFAKYYYKYMHLPRAVKKLGDDALLHHLDHGYAHLIQSNQRSVVTVHDLTHFAYPELSGYSLSSWKKRMLKLKKANHLVAVSQNVADLLMQFLDIPANKISVGYHEIDLDKFTRHDKVVGREKWLGKYQADHYILSVGTNDPKKNIKVLLEAVRKITKEGLNAKLIRVGAKLEFHDDRLNNLVSSLKKNGYLIELGYLPHSKVSELLGACDLFCFPSAYEGFGLPIIEAQAAGIPLICSDASCLPEIAGKGALFHEVDNALALASQIKRVFSDNNLRRDLRELGEVNLKRFQLGSHVTLLKDVYQSLG